MHSGTTNVYCQRQQHETVGAIDHRQRHAALTLGFCFNAIDIIAVELPIPVVHPDEEEQVRRGGNAREGESVGEVISSVCPRPIALYIIIHI